ncbi:MAG: hypothetical protein M1837_000985 [Sclerophora amabilis]|nr:MAG: hypothetical protein M1837_000985 [Sclerophora amabilis]
MESSTKTDRQCPSPLDLSHHFSRATKSREQSHIKDFYKYFAIPGIGQLAGGLPNASMFPYDTLEASVALPQRFTPTPNNPADGRNISSHVARTALKDPASSHLLVPKASATTDLVKKIDLTSGLQYGTAQGYPPLFAFLRQFVRANLHPNVPYADGPEITLTCGNTDGFSKAIEALSNEWSEERDWIREREGLLVEEFCYMNAIQTAKPRGLQIVPVAMDGEGMISEGGGGLRDVLSNWDPSKGKRPHLLYTVTIGQNPTGGTLSVQRRKDLYSVCSEFDVIIIEDDPYWYLQYPSAVVAGKSCCEGISGATLEPLQGQKSSGYEFLDSLVPSYLSVDTDGRVVRLDTFSKTIAPGCRLGWITAQPSIVERILRIAETSTQQPSGFVQLMVAELIIGPPKSDDDGRGGGPNGRGWDVDGWVRWLAGLRGAYERRMQTMCGILDRGKHFVKSSPRIMDSSGRRGSITDNWDVIDQVKMFDFIWPQGGMFIWIQLNLESHPLFGKVSTDKLSRSLWIYLTTRPYLVLVSPGTLFAPTPEIAAAKGYRFFRLCFAAVEEKDLEPISHRFVACFNDFWTKTELKDPEDAGLLSLNHHDVTM